MTTLFSDIDNLKEEGERMQYASNLHQFHWIVIGLSLLLTLGAWYFSHQQVQQKKSLQFDRHTQQIIDIISERMRSYENVLWGGVATVNSQSSGIYYDEWERFASRLHFAQRYPGINGMGVIFNVLPENAEAFLKEQQEGRPDFSIFPETEAKASFPVAFIEPLNKNAESVGLDMTYEAERYAAIKKARDTSLAQMTSPLVLEHSAGKERGFLLFAPIYESSKEVDELVQRRQHFAGLVYAPFVARNLVQDALGDEQRLVGIQIKDDGRILYDEHIPEVSGFDAAPSFSHVVHVSLYGRHWEFDIRSKLSFETAYHDNQPILILLAGLLIDAFILLFFILLARSNRKAIVFAEKVTEGYEKKSNILKQVNNELEMFTYHASHDIRSPLMSMSSLIAFSKKYLDSGDNSRVEVCLDHIGQTTESMVRLIEDILELTKLKHTEYSFEKIDFPCLLDSIMENLSQLEGFNTIEITKELNCSERLLSMQVRLASIIDNLLSNAIKYHDPRKAHSFIKLLAKEDAGVFTLTIEDNGLGIPEQYHAKLFGMFQRFHPDVSFGTGLGLYLCKRHAEALGGSVSYNDLGDGSCFSVVIPLPG